MASIELRLNRSLSDIAEESDDFELQETPLKILFSEAVAMIIQECRDEEIMAYMGSDVSHMTYFARRSFRMVESELLAQFKIVDVSEEDKTKMLRVFKGTYLQSLSVMKPVLETLSQQMPRFKVIVSSEYIEEKLANKEISALQEIAELCKYLNPVYRHRLKDFLLKENPALLQEFTALTKTLKKIETVLQRAETYLPKPQMSSLETSS